MNYETKFCSHYWLGSESKSHRTALSNAAARNSHCPTDPPHAPSILSRKIQSVAAYIPESNAVPVTPREPKFTRMGEGLSGFHAPIFFRR